MEINTMTGVDKTTVGAFSTIATCVSPIAASVRPCPDAYRPAVIGRGGIDAVAGFRSQAGVGSNRVPAMWQDDLQLIDPKMHRFTHKFTTRQGPPTCSPPS